jgi:hypothetical protein
MALTHVDVAVEELLPWDGETWVARADADESREALLALLTANRIALLDEHCESVTDVEGGALASFVVTVRPVDAQRVRDLLTQWLAARPTLSSGRNLVARVTR